MTNNQLTEAEITETLDAATSGYPLTASVEANLRRVFAELQKRRKPLQDKDLQGVLGALEHPAGINAAGKQVVRSALVELQERRKADSEPVASNYRKLFTCTGCGAEGLDEPLETNCHCCVDGAHWVESRLYRHAQPEPVVMVDLLGMAASAIEDLLEHTDPNTNYYSGVWADVPGKLRDALLQAEPVTTANKLPELIEGMEVSIDVSTCDADAGNRYFGTVAELSELDGAKNGYILLVHDAKPNFNQSGNSPVIPDGYVMVPKEVTLEISNAINVVGNRCTCGNCSQRLWDLLLAAATQEVGDA
ncbi:hypothetical protein ACU615_12960 [Klebsiella aerogenes]